MLFTSGLSGFLLETLADVTNAFVLVWIGLLQRPDIRRNLAHLLAVDTGNHQTSLLIDCDVDTWRDRILNRMRKAQRKYHRILPVLGTITNAHDLQFLRKAFRDTAHSIGNEGTRQSVEGPLRTAVVLTYGKDLFILLLEPDAGRNRIRNRTFWSANDDLVRFDLDLHLLRH